MGDRTPTLHPALLSADQLLAQCHVEHRRDAGPGGQHRNKVQTAIRIVHTPTGITGSAGERRSQAQNHKAAQFRLRVNLALEVRGGLAEHAPSALWRSRCRGGRVSINPAHDDFPAMLAEVLDVVTAHAADIKPAADRLGCSRSQLTRFLKLEPRALGLVNDQRRRRGATVLR